MHRRGSFKQAGALGWPQSAIHPLHQSRWPLQALANPRETRNQILDGTPTRMASRKNGHNTKPLPTVHFKGSRGVVGHITLVSIRTQEERSNAMPTTSLPSSFQHCRLQVVRNMLHTIAVAMLHRKEGAIARRKVKRGANHGRDSQSGKKERNHCFTICVNVRLKNPMT